ncbi:hypothetical protein H3S74_12240 [Gilliamella sp. W8126]|uniref:hypothetical protein n=1 Tax=Gilliamella sp. W8126 TaxID=2750946 RepID=UPI0018DEA752|nr:hypothetical protein [Gilliamella sp. W8126]MBI0006999.1 hypothetical protein [Gilliamella sp. W8126]
MIKKIVIFFFLTIGLAACGDKTNYQGQYKADSGLLLIIEKSNDSDYKFTTEIFDGKKFTVSATVKNKNQLYDSKGNLLGEFDENKNFKNTKGVNFSKIN